MGQARNNSSTAAGGALVKVAIITFAAGLLVMLAVLHFNAPGNQATLIFSSALLLAVLVAPLVYALVLGPMVVALEEGKKPAAKALPAQAALTDPVTQLPNRHGITSSLLEFMAHAERYGTPLSVALVQIQNLRKLSDELAPRGAEKATTAVAEVFYDTLRRPDKAGRYDNDQFLVVLPHTKLKDAGLIAERIRTSVSQRELGAGATKGVKMSVISGAVQFRKGDDLEQLLSRAEQAKQGKGGRRAAVKKAAR